MKGPANTDESSGENENNEIKPDRPGPGLRTYVFSGCERLFPDSDRRRTRICIRPDRDDGHTDHLRPCRGGNDRQGVTNRAQREAEDAVRNDIICTIIMIQLNNLIEHRHICPYQKNEISRYAFPSSNPDCSEFNNSRHFYRQSCLLSE